MTTMSERSARLLPDDPRSHTERINDWKGSNVYVQESRRDPGDTPMPSGKTFKYMLKEMAFDGMNLIPAGSVVEIFAVQVGPHHQPIDGEKYDADHKAAQEAMSRPWKPPMIEETIPLDHHKQVVAGLQPQIDALKKENAALRAAIDKEVAAAAKKNEKKA
jgi:hypothetical protein